MALYPYVLRNDSLDALRGAIPYFDSLSEAVIRQTLDKNLSELAGQLREMEVSPAVGDYLHHLCDTSPSGVCSLNRMLP